MYIIHPFFIIIENNHIYIRILPYNFVYLNMIKLKQLIKEDNSNNTLKGLKKLFKSEEDKGKVFQQYLYVNDLPNGIYVEPDDPYTFDEFTIEFIDDYMIIKSKKKVLYKGIPSFKDAISILQKKIF